MLENEIVTITQGDIFVLGEHQLMCGDATDTETVKKVVQGHNISAVVTDPPYGVAYVESKKDFLTSQTNNTHKVIANDQAQSDEEYIQFSKKWLSCIKPFLNEKNSCYIFNSDKMLFALREAMLQEGFKFAQLLIWIKNHAVVGRMDYLPQHELIVYGWCGTHQFQKSKDKSILFHPKPNKSALHPTMKPVSLIRQLILNSTKINEVVYEPFCGSGTTLIACEQTKRKCIALELDPEYCKTIIERFEKVSGQKARKVIYGNE